jgi:hypothetical protein
MFTATSLHHQQGTIAQHQAAPQVMDVILGKHVIQLVLDSVSQSVALKLTE